MVQDAIQIKRKIIEFIKIKGPSLPVHVSKETGLSILFASAFLSDLYGEKEIGISNIKVGSSPLYFIPGQEPQLENFAQYLKSKEKEAFLLLKENKFLKDSELQPAIRVALREIKDFAIPFKEDEEIYWRYFTNSPNEFNKEIEIPKVEAQIEKEETKITEVKEEKRIENIFENKIIETGDKEIIKKEKIKQIKPKKPQKNKKQDENFFNKIKEFLEKKNVEILDIKDFRNNEATLKVKRGNEEELLFAFNQKKITEKEILKAHKKALENKMKYSILSLAETPKKLKDLIEAAKDLSAIDKIE